MKITLFAAGSRGDIQPCIALSKSLKAAGYQVCLAAPEDFADFAQEHAVDFWPVRGDVQRLMASETGRKFMESGSANPFKSIRAIRTLIGPVITQMTEDAYAACRNTDALICLGVQSAFGQAITEATRKPLINLEPTPLLPTTAFAAPGWPIQRNFGGLHNRLSGLAMLFVLWQWYRPFVNEFRHRLGLRSATAASTYRALRSTPLISAYSSAFIPQPADWPATAHITGYFFLAEPSQWQPPSELAAFLTVGEPPVYIGFGSMAGRNPERLAALTIEALAQSGQRGLLLTGWGGLRAESVPDNVLIVKSAPHSWLFPRMAAVVHHGGAGTTAEGLRAGIPTVIVPFVFDQAFWGARIKTRGLGPAPIPIKHLTPDRLAHAIGQAVTDQAMRQRASACGQRIRAENGLDQAVQLVRHYLGEP